MAQKIFDDAGAHGRHDGFGMKLKSVDLIIPMTQPHDFSSVSLRSD